MQRPNIILLTCDQLQAFATGCYGNVDVQTPQIDALAASGVRFTHGISNAPVCMAGRSCLLSGQHNRLCTGGVSNVHYIHGKIGSYPLPEYPAPGRLHFPEKTLPELLRSDGYRTGAIGKWHLYVWPDVIGFDHYVIPRTHHVHSAQMYVEDGAREFSPEGWSTEFETDRAIRYLQQHADDDRPYFLYLNYSPPHPPLNDCPARYLQMYDPATLTLRKNVEGLLGLPGEHDVRTYRWDYRYYELQLPYTLGPMDYTIRNVYAAYYGNVTWLDDNIGRLMAGLESTGQREDTIVVFVADHGDNLGSHGRSGKGLPFDESLRVPMIYSCPSRWSARVENRTVTGLVDVAPTLLASAGMRIPAHMSGRDAISQPCEQQIVEISPGDLAVRTERFTAHVDTRAGGARLAFYDNAEDPFQMRNLVGGAHHADEQDRLFALLEDHHRRVPVMPEPDYGLTTP